jgi:hypothetical protein
VSYDWRPTASRSATTDPSIVVAPAPRHWSSATATAPGSRREAITTAAAIDEFVEAAETGLALNRSGRPYKPSALRDLRGILEYHVAPELGELALRDVRRGHVQALVDRLAAERLSESRIRSVVSALRALFGHAIERGHAEFNPADGLVMPSADEAAPSGSEAATTSWSDRLEDLWQNRPTWEDQLRWEGQPRSEGRPRSEGQPAREGPSSAPRAERKPLSERRGRSRKGRGKRDSDREREAYEPIALLPERILSFAMRIVFALFALLALVSLLESI